MILTIKDLMKEENIVTVDKAEERYDETWDLELGEHLSLNPAKYAIINSDDVDNYPNFIKLHNYITDKYTGKVELHKFVTKDDCDMYYYLLDVDGYPVVNVTTDGGLIVYYMPLNMKAVL